MRGADGYVPIAGYAAIGDGRTIALVAADGSIDWLPVPALDGPPVFSALLDADRGGSFALEPAEPYDAERRYVDDTNLLETTFTTADGVVRVTDGLLLQDGGMLSWIELARRVEGLSGRVRMRWALHATADYGRAETRVERRGDAVLLHAGSAVVAFRTWDAGEAATDGEFEVGGGERALLARQICVREPIALPPRHEIELRFDRTADAWRRWAAFHTHESPWQRAVTRSALALKLLIASHTGAIAAAPTTSLPERIGGDKNWDYRFSWVRDSALTMDSLGALGYREQVHASLSWLLRATESTHPKLRPFYQLEGGEPGAAEELDLPGYRGSRPVRRGNDAGEQRQLGSYGDLLETIYLYVEHGNALDPGTAGRVVDVVEHLRGEWRKKDSGIWELPNQRHYTISKINCWAAFDRAVRLAERGELPDDQLERWRDERSEVRAWIEERCWSEAQGAYAFAAGSDDLDASVLLAARVGFLERGDSRLDATIDAVRRELGAGGPLLYRYTGQEDDEGAFLACSFWLVIALARAGRVTEARATMEELLPLANDVGLYAEELDPATGEHLGNFPQGLTHLSLIIAAKAVADAERAG